MKYLFRFTSKPSVQFTHSTHTESNVISADSAILAILHSAHRGSNPDEKNNNKMLKVTFTSGPKWSLTINKAMIELAEKPWANFFALGGILSPKLLLFN